MLHQLHYEWLEYGEITRTEFVTQRDIHNNEELRVFVKETQEHHPLPKGAIWLVCTPRSVFFVKTLQETL